MRLAGETHLDALLSGLMDGDLGAGSVQAAEAAQAAPHPEGPPTAVDLVLEGLPLLVKGDLRSGAALVRRALEDLDDPAWAPRIQLAVGLSLEVWDFAAWQGVVSRAVERARSTGALMPLTQALGVQAGVDVRAVRLRRAAAALDEAEALIAFTGTAPTYPRLGWSAVRGVPDTGELIDRHIADAADRGEGLLTAFAAYARAVFHNGRGDPGAALTSATHATEHLQLAFRGLALRELIEAAVYAGAAALAAEAFPRLQRGTSVAGTDWAHGVEASCAALLAAGEESIELRRTAIRHLERSGAGMDLTRARPFVRRASAPGGTARRGAR